MTDLQKFDFEKIQAGVKQKSRRRNLLLILGSVLVTILLFFGGRWLVDYFYYNPAAGNQLVEKDSYIFNRQLLNDLTEPNLDLKSYQISQSGPAAYDISEIYRRPLQDSGTVTRNYQIEKGRLINPTVSPFDSRDLDGFFEALFSRSSESSGDAEATRQNLRENLKGLPQSTYLTVNVTFDKDLSFTELEDWKTYSAPQAEARWYAIRTLPLAKSGSIVPYPPVGISAFQRGRAVLSTKENKQLAEKYPLLLENNLTSQQSSWSEEKKLTTRLHSTFSYLLDQSDFWNLYDSAKGLSTPTVTQSQLQEMSDYLAKNGVKFYGVTLELSVQELMGLLDQNDGLDLVTVTGVNVFPLSGQHGQLPDVSHLLKE